MGDKTEFIKAYRMGYMGGATFGYSGKFDPNHLEAINLDIVDEHAEKAYKVRQIQILEGS